MMKPEEKQDAIQRYNERLKQYGYDPRTLGWTKNKEAVRFRILTEIGDMNGCSILDVGCGFGDLYGYLTAKGYTVDYTGYDINPGLIEIARRVYPDARFEVKDIETDDTDSAFDWVIESGVFNYRLSDNQSFMRAMMKRMFRLCKRGVAADYLSSYVDWQNEQAYYYHPEEVFNFCKTLSKRVSLRHDYMPFEFCAYLYKDDSITEKNVFSSFDTTDNVR